MKNSDPIEGYILAGGASTRMGRPKSELMLGSSSLVERAVSAMSELTGERVTVVGNDVSVNSVEQRVKVIADLSIEPGPRDRDRRAPIFGFFTALNVATAEWIAVLAVDLPFVSGELLSRLASLRGDKLNAVVPVQPDGRLQPLCAIYRRNVFHEAARTAIDANELSLHKLLRGACAGRVEFSELAELKDSENFFFNVNTPDDLETAAKLAESSRVVL